MDESAWYPAGKEGVLDEAGWRALVETVREAQAVIEGEFGLKASFHPHVGTAVEREAQIDRVLQETDIDLCFDTGHHAFWGQDPLRYMQKVWGRIAYMHLKNVDAAVRQRVLDEAGWRGLVETVREAQAVIEGEFGLKASFHPHVGTAVELESQIDRLLAETDIDLCFDTGHHAFWGQDPLAYMKKVWGRIAYMHLKNVDAAVRQRVLDRQLSIAASYGAGVMAPLPDGAVDIQAIMAFLEEKRFDGPVVVEQDVAENAAETPLQLAKRNLDYVRAIA
jgi:sugar phosphate isomerase/epimerase